MYIVYWIILAGLVYELVWWSAMAVMSAWEALKRGTK